MTFALCETPGCIREEGHRGRCDIEPGLADAEAEQDAAREEPA